MNKISVRNAHCHNVHIVIDDIGVNFDVAGFWVIGVIAGAEKVSLNSFAIVDSD